MKTTVSTDSLAKFSRLQRSLHDRVKEGILPFERVFAGLQDLAAEIDLDAAPRVPYDTTVVKHKKGGKFFWDPTKVRLHVFQEQTKGVIGHKLRRQLASQSVLNANLLDYLLAHPDLIPENWAGKYVFFWGTIFRDTRCSLLVRCLYWRNGRGHWDSKERTLGYHWEAWDHAVVRTA